MCVGSIVQFSDSSNIIIDVVIYIDIASNLKSTEILAK